MIRYPIPASRQEIAHRARLVEGLHANMLAFLIATVISCIIAVLLHFHGADVTDDIWITTIGGVVGSAVSVYMLNAYWLQLVPHIDNMAEIREN